MRKTIALLLVLVLIASSTVSFLPVKANPYMYHESVSAPAYVKLPNITIASPRENAFYSTNGTITLSFNVTGPDAPNLLTKYLSIVDYKGDWMQDAEHAYRTKNFEEYTPDDFPFFLEFNFNITGIPNGKHSIIITALGGGGYAEGLTWYSFGINSSSSVDFTMGTIPIVSFLSFQNSTFKSSFVPLNFTVDQPVSEMAYCLDGQRIMTISGNTTLTGLSNGYHNVTVYATDVFGNVGASETLFFNVDAPEPESFPTVPVVAVSSASILVVCAGLVLYFNKRKREVEHA
jgi:hypothetical protein